VQRDTAVPEVDALLVQVVPDRLDVERITADDELAEPLRDRVRGRHLDRRACDGWRRIRLADAEQALVRLDADDERVLGPVRAQLDLGKSQNDRLDTGDAHGYSSWWGGVRPLG